MTASAEQPERVDEERSAIAPDVATAAAPLSGTSAAHVQSETVQSALHAPARNLTELRIRLRNASRGTYMDYMLAESDSMLTRWPERTATPVRVWVQPDASHLPGWSAEMPLIAERAFLAWREFDIPLRFHFVRDSSNAEISVKWTERLQGSQVGITKRIRDQHGWIVRAEIVLALHVPSGAPLERQFMGAIAVHEIGHAIGIDHSPNAADIMAAQNSGVFQPTRTDKATLSLIYSMPPGSLSSVLR